MPPIRAHAPVLFVPEVFDHDLCRYLIGVWEREGSEDSGFMKDVGGRTSTRAAACASPSSAPTCTSPARARP